MLNEVKSRFLSGKKIFTITILIIGLTTFTNAQGITNTLGGNTAAEKFIIKNSDSEVGLVVTGEGKVGIGINDPISTLSVGGNGHNDAVIYGETTNSNGCGVYGIATKTGNVTNYGGYFTAAGDNGYGVVGYASKTGDNITNYGGYFIATGDHGYGVTGICTGEHGRGVSGTASGSGYGVFGTSDIGAGVRGVAQNSGALNNWGGYFEGKGSFGRGVYGYASHTSGNNYGVYGKSDSNNGYDFYANGAGTDYGASSSIRWKTNIIEIDNPLEKLAELRGVYFDWDEEHGGQHDIGCIAEEVGKVLPEIVVYEENGIDANGMDYSKLTPLLIEAIKALQKRVEELENR